MGSFPNRLQTDKVVHTAPGRKNSVHNRVFKGLFVTKYIIHNDLSREDIAVNHHQFPNSKCLRRAQRTEFNRTDQPWLKQRPSPESREKREKHFSSPQNP